MGKIDFKNYNSHKHINQDLIYRFWISKKCPDVLVTRQYGKDYYYIYVGCGVVMMHNLPFFE